MLFRSENANVTEVELVERGHDTRNSLSIIQQGQNSCGFGAAGACFFAPVATVGRLQTAAGSRRKQASLDGGRAGSRHPTVATSRKQFRISAAAW